jgi:hypothetical protein
VLRLLHQLENAASQGRADDLAIAKVEAVQLPEQLVDAQNLAEKVRVGKYHSVLQSCAANVSGRGVFKRCRQQTNAYVHAGKRIATHVKERVCLGVVRPNAATVRTDADGPLAPATLARRLGERQG